MHPLVNWSSTSPAKSPIHCNSTSCPIRYYLDGIRMVGSSGAISVQTTLHVDLTCPFPKDLKIKGLGSGGLPHHAEHFLMPVGQGKSFKLLVTMGVRGSQSAPK